MIRALRHGVNTVVLPHSRVHNVPIKVDGPAPLCLHHALQGGPCLDLADRMLPTGLMRAPGDWATPAGTGELRTLGLVLTLFPMMILKFGIVCAYFMHLKYDNPLFRRVFVFGLLLAIIVYGAALTAMQFWSGGGG